MALIATEWVWRAAVWWMVLALYGVTGLSAAAERPVVLVIESYHTEYVWDQQYTRALHEALDAVAELQFFAMDTKRRPAAEHPTRADAAWQQYLALNPALVVLADDNALKLLGPRLVGRSTPVVYLGINQNPRRYLDLPQPNFSGVLERPFLKRSIAYLNGVMAQPLKKVLVLFDSGTTSQTVFQEEFAGKAAQLIGSAVVQIKLVESETQWQREVTEAPANGYDLIVVGLYHTLVDDQGQHVPEQRVLAWSGQHSVLPLFCFWAFSVGPGMTAGGLVLDGYDQGKAAATMVREVLAGGQLPRLPVSPGGDTLLFSRAQLNHWGIQLPERIARQATLVP